MATTGKGSVKQLSQQLDGFSNKIKKLYGELGKLQKGTKEYAKKQKELNAANKQAVKLSDQLYKKQQRLISGNKKHKSSIDAATTSQKKFQQTMTSTAASTGKAAKAQTSFGKKLGTAVGTVARYAGAAALLNVGLKVFRALTTDALKEAIKFEKALANLAAVAGVSGNEIEKLSENALKVAGSTKFTAEEIVKLQTELSKLGFTADEVVKSTQPIAFAAQALGSPLEATAALVGKVRNQFGLLVEQTSEISDVLVTSINESALSFESFGTAMQYIGPIASSLGLSLQQTAGAMAVLSDSGFTASRVGTGLRGILTEIGKTSGDAEKSLKKLAEQNINLAEAADLVGKRNAAQLLTLLRNLDAIEESNTKYYQQGRALESASKQINTFSGQVDLLNAALKKFQIEIGNSIVESDFLLNVMSILSEEASQTALAFKTIADVGFEKYDESVKNVVDGSDILDEALSLSGATLDEYDEALELLSKNRALETALSFDIDGLNQEYEAAIRLYDTVEGLAEAIQDSVKAKKEDAAITKGQTRAQEVYGKTVEKIIQQSIDGVNVNNEISDSYETLRLLIEDLDTQIEKTSGLRQLQLKAERNVYKQMQEQLNNSLKNEDELLKIRTKNQRDALKLRLDDIKRQTKEELKEINERAKVETSISKTAEQRADIEAERTKLVSDAYVKQSAAIRGLSKEFETQTDRIKAAALASDDLAEILTSDVISDVEKAISDYSKEIKKLDEDLKNSKITQEEYNAARDAQYEGLLNNINAFKQLVDISPEVSAYFDEIAKKALEAAYAIDKVPLAASKTKDDFKEIIDGIQDTLESEIDAITAITNVELQGAKTAEETAQIRLKQEKLIQAAYSNSLRSVENLKDAYPGFADEIQNASDKYEQFTQFTQSDVGKEGINILSDYKKSFEELGKQLSDGTITLSEYEEKEDALEASLISSITTLKSSTVANQELKDMLDRVVVSYLNAKKSADDYIDSTDDAIKTTKLLGKTLVKDLTIEEAIGMSLAATTDAISKFNDTALENTKARLASEKDEITARYKTEEDILKSQLNNQLITESQYRQKQKELRKSQIAEENEIDKKIFESEKKRDRQNATTGYLQALASIIPNLIVYDKEANPIGLSIKAALSGALATASYGAELAAIGQRKFVAKRFADGGIVNGPSHEQGGVPFTVQGRGGYEMEGGEYVVNKRATSMHRDLLERINKTGRLNPTVGRMKFAEGGLVSSPMNESVDYLKAIAEATTSTAIQSSKPVRAYVADKDLRGNATERRIRDRNDRI